MSAVPSRLRGEQLTLAYGNKTIAESLNVTIPDGHFTAIIGPNGCGKSTLLRTLSRLMTPTSGHVWLDGAQIQQYASKEVARRIGLLAQNATTPGDITVQELVARGRYPHQPLFTRWRKEDEAAVNNAMRATGISDLALQSVDTLSGGQRQRAWIAMVLAQETAIMLLDEPTTWLDISHQIDLLELLSELNREKGYTLAAVLHDLNQACRYATHLIALRDGKIVAEGAPKEVVTADLIERIYGLRCTIIEDPVAHTPLVELVARGRYPHQPLFTRWRKEDEAAVNNAMRATGISDLALQSVDTLSGGQRQRAWIAMVLAQETAIMLLDEPTTWLDISHQIDLLELLSELNREKGYTLAAVLHDLNQACRYATHLIALRDGKIVAEGAPKEVVTADLIERIYGLRCTIIEDPVAHTPLVVPLGRR